jgi:hypothetical protein
MQAFALMLIVASLSTEAAPVVEQRGHHTIVFDHRAIVLMRENKALVAPWTTYALMLYACSSTSRGNGNEDAPTFACEVEARDFTADSWAREKTKDPKAVDAYLDDLLKVKNNGFLEAYVKYYFPRPEWGDIAVANYSDFLVWKVKNLSAHVSETRLIASFK